MSENLVVKEPGITIYGSPHYQTAWGNKPARLDSIDLLRGIVMIIMALDHTRDYFHKDAFLFSPTDLTQTNSILFFTRFITHYCAPVFVFLAGISAFLYGTRRTKRELTFFLFSRGLFLVLAEPLIITLEQTFNPTYPLFNLQVIFAIGVSMISLSAIVQLNRKLILALGLLLIAGHNLLDNIHVPGSSLSSFEWALLHDPGQFTFGRFTFFVHYPVIPWIGIISIGYYIGFLFSPGYDAQNRQKALLWLGVTSIVLFIILRAANGYGDAAHWAEQMNDAFSFLSFLNVTKYPPSLLYVLMTLGPAFLFLALTEKPLNALTKGIAVFGRVPMFYYIAHIFLIHGLAIIAVMLQGHPWTDMILNTRVNSSPRLKGYGYDLVVVYLIWMAVVCLLYPWCKSYDQYKRMHGVHKWWLSYL